MRARVDRAYPSYEVRNPIHGTRHRVLAPVGPDGAILLCLCPDFGRRDLGTCKHVEAVRASSVDAPERGARGPFRPTGEVWDRLDRALAAEPPRPWTDLRARERTGRELLRPEGNDLGRDGRGSEGGSPTSSSRAPA